MLPWETRMSINVACDCGKEFKVKDELAGKKIKCPVCQSVLTVAAASEDVATGPAPRTGKRAVADEDVAAGLPRAGKRSTFSDVDEEDEVRREGKGLKKKKRAAKNSKTMLYVGIGAGVLVLGMCCVGIVGGAAWYFMSGSGSAEKVMVGKWKIDIEETKKIIPESEKKNAELGLAFMSALVFEFKADKTWSMALGEIGAKGKWKVLSSKGSTATLEVTKDDSTETAQWTVTVINNDRIRIDHDKTDKGENGSKENRNIVLKRT
jgi:hypothetical protein